MSVATRKIAAIVRCIERARTERAQAGERFKQDFTRQDAAVLNVTRACEAAIDLANMIVRSRRQDLNMDIVESVIRDALDGLLAFAEAIRPELDTGSQA